MERGIRQRALMAAARRREQCPDYRLWPLCGITALLCDPPGAFEERALAERSPGGALIAAAMSPAVVAGAASRVSGLAAPPGRAVGSTVGAMA